MSVKVGYFAAGAVPTAGEKAEIDKINTWAAKTAEVHVMNGAAVGSSGSSIQVFDYVAGTVPAAYSGLGYATLDPDNPPDSPALPDTQTVLSNAEEIPLDTAGTVTVSVAAGAISAAELESDEAVVTDADTVAVVNSAGTASDDATAAVAAHAVTNVALPETKTVVQTADTVPVDSETATLTVAAGVLASGALASTQKIVKHDDTVSVDSNNATASVVAKALTLALPATKQVVSHGDIVAVINSADTTTDDATAVITAKNLELQLPATKTIVEDGDTVTVDGVSVPLAVTAGALGASTLISEGSTSKVITSGIEIPATGTISTKVTVTIVNGAITACVGG